MEPHCIESMGFHWKTLTFDLAEMYLEAQMELEGVIYASINRVPSNNPALVFTGLEISLHVVTNPPCFCRFCNKGGGELLLGNRLILLSTHHRPVIKPP